MPSATGHHDDPGMVRRRALPGRPIAALLRAAPEHGGAETASTQTRLSPSARRSTTARAGYLLRPSAPPLSACQYPRRRARPATGSIAESSIRVDADLRRSARIYPRTNAGSVPPALVYDRQRTALNARARAALAGSSRPARLASGPASRKQKRPRRMAMSPQSCATAWLRKRQPRTGIGEGLPFPDRWVRTPNVGRRTGPGFG
jgi:hypothetical protein